MLLLAAFLVLNERGDLFIFLYEIVQNRVQRFMFGYFKTSFDIMGAVCCCFLELVVGTVWIV